MKYFSGHYQINISISMKTLNYSKPKQILISDSLILFILYWYTII